MTAATDYAIEVKFDRKVKLRRVAGSTIQKDEKKKRSRKVLGSTSPRMEITDPVLVWETEGEGAEVTLRLVSIAATITFATQIKIDKAIDTATTCYKEVKAHELEHVKIWQSGVKRFAPKIVSELEMLFARLLPAEEALPAGKVKARQQRADEVVRQLLPWTAQHYGEKISRLSKKHDTKAELDRIQGICGLYLLQP
ncbi:hypothetical protein LNKW23_05050 [Paralimibaculum aggregatum]|uniref:DUF922 domain-containing protein n=1 Tax=Paralimibaculum aggregatum TaxID=3036245 RepID=A0ABQ6LI23_9RHOB|nr:hypothetical protein [Limibaculum sp. NKW23]GMG81292.1 hypothetical protein LNKW23_05050 [Limibaculum sp. NKW23]